MKNKVIITSAICIPLFILAGLLFTDSHNTHLKYLMWKRGWVDGSQERSLRYMTVDASFRNSLKGKTKSEVMQWFPDLRTEEYPDPYLDSSQPFFISTPDFLWIGDTQWAIGFENERVEEFYIIKGEPKLEDRKCFRTPMQQ